jgi:hypothetical protein
MLVGMDEELTVSSSFSDERGLYMLSLSHSGLAGNARREPGGFFLMLRQFAPLAVR